MERATDHVESIPTDDPPPPSTPAVQTEGDEVRVLTLDRPQRRNTIDEDHHPRRVGQSGRALALGSSGVPPSAGTSSARAL